MSEPLWVITDLPRQRGSSDDYVGWLRGKNGVHVKVHISPNVGHEGARLIMQQFAGIITPENLNRMLDGEND